MKNEITYITILSVTVTLIIVSLLFWYFYTDIKSLVENKKININLSLLPPTESI